MTRHSIRYLPVLLSTISGFAACGGGSSDPSTNTSTNTNTNTNTTTASQWVGKTFLIDTPNVSSDNWTKPPAPVGATVGADVPQFLIGVAAGSGNDLTITLSTAINGVQDMCTPTTQVTASGAKFPNVDISAPNFPIHISVISAKQTAQALTTVHNFVLKDVLPGLSSNATSELDAVIDLAEMYPLFLLIPESKRTKEEVCSELAAMTNNETACEQCEFNQQTFCLTLQAVQISAKEVGTTIKSVTSADIASSCTN